MRDTKPVKNFVVIPKSMGRCGSTWFCDLLDSHPAVACLEEVFNPGQATRYGPVLGHLGASRAPARLYEGIELFRPDASLFGFKVFREQIGDHHIANIIDFVDAVLLIDRQNLTAALASTAHAQATQLWHAQGTRGEHRAAEVRVAIDLDLARRELEHAAATSRLLTRLVAWSGALQVVVTYEDLVADTQRTMDQVFAALGVEPRPVQSSYRKIHHDAGFVTNLDEVNRVLGPEFGYLDRG